MRTRLLLAYFAGVLILCVTSQAQTPEFTYQGRLVDGSLAASGTYEMRFRLFDAETGGTQQPQPTPITIDFTVAGSNPVTVTNGVFTVKLDFTASAFPGTARFLEISVRRTATDPFVVLDPRQPITSAPHNIRSLSSGSSDGLSVACILCVTDAQILSLDGSKVTGTVASATTAANISGIVPVTNGGTGSSTQNFVDLSTNQTNIGGNKTFTGTVNLPANGLQVGTNQIVTSGGGVGIGRIPDFTTLDVRGNTAFGVRVENMFAGTGAVGVFGSAGASASFNNGLQGVARGNGATNYGVFGIADGNNATNYAVYGRANGGGSSTNWAGYFEGNAHVVGNLSATGTLNANGSGLTNLNANNITGGTLAIANGGTGSQTQNFVDLSTNQTVGGNKTFTGAVGVSGGSGVFNGNGSGLTNLNGANIAGGTITSTQLSSEAVPNSSAYKLLGSLRWDILKPQANFAIGSSPFGVAFDGTNIWATNRGSNNIMKLRASDGAILGTFTVAGGPVGVAFDGTNMWVANQFTNNVTKLRASDGANLGNFAAGTTPFAIAFDGANIWVVNSTSNNVTKLRASDGANLGTFPTGGTGAFEIAFDGANIWVTNYTSNNVVKLRASDGANLGTFPVGTNPVGIAFDGNNIWVANEGTDNLTKLRASDGANLGTFPVGDSPQSLSFDGGNIWTANFNSNNATKLRTSDGVNLGTFPVGTNPFGVAFDGANIWVTNLSSNNVTRLLPAFPQP